MKTQRFSLVAGLIFVIIVFCIAWLPDEPILETAASFFDQQNPLEHKPELVLDPVTVTGSAPADKGAFDNNLDDATSQPVIQPLPSPGIDISGMVRDENNQPIENALVSDESLFGSVRTDAHGHYRIKIDMPKFKSPFLNFLRTGYQENRVGVPIDKVTAQSTLELNVTLSAGSSSTTVHGQVGNASGAGLPGVKIELRARRFEQSGAIFYAVISDENGGFAFEGIRSGLEYRLYIAPSEKYAGFRLESYRVSHSTPPTRIVLETLRLVNVDGIIVDTDNAPVANFEINVQNLSVDYPDRKISSDSSGFFRLENFPAGEIKLSSSAPEYYKIVGLRLSANDYRNLRLTIDKGGYYLSGWVSDNHGKPIAQARVTLGSVFDKESYQSHSHRSTMTDGNGGFDFSRLGGQEHTLNVHAPGYITHVQTHRFSSFSDSLLVRLSVESS